MNYGIYKTMGAELGVELTAAAGGVTARLHDIAGQKVRNTQTFPLPAETDAEYRLDVHRVSDEIARWASGTAGMAATRFLFVSDGRVYRIDSDGEQARAAHAGGPDRALAGVVARRTNDRVHPAGRRARRR